MRTHGLEKYDSRASPARLQLYFSWEEPVMFHRTSGLLLACALGAGACTPGAPVALPATPETTPGPADTRPGASDDTLLIAGITRDSGDASLASAVIRMNPINGRITQAIPLNTQPTLLALSSNGRYLYAGLQELPAVERIDLTRGRPDLRIPLGGDASGRPAFACSFPAQPGHCGSRLDHHHADSIPHVGKGNHVDSA